IFLDDTPQRIAELDLSLKSGDVTRFIRAAHSIKGSSANMGASLLRGVAERLEHHAKEHGLADVGAMLSELRAEWANAELAIRELIKT
ncbi:MAG: Hpt domain-containing protein, partial [Opitutaceae bacterium]